jgi:hypothetical protein
MPSPQSAKKGLWIIVIFCPELKLFAIMVGHRKPPDLKRKGKKLEIRSDYRPHVPGAAIIKSSGF